MPVRSSECNLHAFPNFTFLLSIEKIEIKELVLHKSSGIRPRIMRGTRVRLDWRGSIGGWSGDHGQAKQRRFINFDVVWICPIRVSFSYMLLRFKWPLARKRNVRNRMAGSARSRPIVRRSLGRLICVIEAPAPPPSGLPPSYISVRNAAGGANISLLTGGVVVGTRECHRGLWLAVTISSRCRRLVHDAGGRSPDAVLVGTWAGGGGMPLWPLLGRGGALSPRRHRALVRGAGVFRPDAARWWGWGAWATPPIDRMWVATALRHCTLSPF